MKQRGHGYMFACFGRPLHFHSVSYTRYQVGLRMRGLLTAQTADCYAGCRRTNAQTSRCFYISLCRDHDRNPAAAALVASCLRRYTERRGNDFDKVRVLAPILRFSIFLVLFGLSTIIQWKYWIGVGLLLRSRGASPGINAALSALSARRPSLGLK